MLVLFSYGALFAAIGSGAQMLMSGCDSRLHPQARPHSLDTIVFSKNFSILCHRVASGENKDTSQHFNPCDSILIVVRSQFPCLVSEWYRFYIYP